MNPVRKKRLYIVLAILCGVSIAVAWYIVSRRENVTPPPKASTTPAHTPASQL